MLMLPFSTVPAIAATSTRSLLDMEQSGCPPSSTRQYPPFNFGGDGITVRRLANALAEQGHDVEVERHFEAYFGLIDDRPAARAGSKQNQGAGGRA
jgi:hypothetical protein